MWEGSVSHPGRSTKIFANGAHVYRNPFLAQIDFSWSTYILWNEC